MSASGFDDAHPEPLRWHRSTLADARLAELLRASDARGLLQVAAHAGLLLVTGSACLASFTQGRYAMAALLLFVHGACFSFLGFAGAAHELAHRTVFKTRACNDACLFLFAFLTWNNPLYFRASHARHHRGTLHAALDGEVRAPANIVLSDWIWELSVDVPAMRRAVTITFDNARNIIRGEWGARLFAAPEHSRRGVVRWARIMLAGHAALAAGFVLSGHWPLLLLVTCAPFIATWFNKTLALAQHAGMQAEVNDFRLNSRTVELNPVLGFLYWQMHYHVEHHMYPGVPFHHLKALRREISGDLPPACRGMRGVIRELLAHRRRCGRDGRSGLFDLLARILGAPRAAILPMQVDGESGDLRNQADAERHGGAVGTGIQVGHEHRKPSQADIGKGQAFIDRAC